MWRATLEGVSKRVWAISSRGRVVPLVTDACENGHRRLAKELGEFHVVEPCQVGHRATSTNHNQGVEWHLLVGCEGLEDGSLDRG